ncbi:hypothetical protein E2562_029015 [Oryza meyeriana var. granulata]|uniref:Uncharacterized protein n=1 Tax=Oryza meyeriana var. granulata TaxID=110450 RepID=A0A6G1E4A4_9ORYZ|nr:hypothetical protein E2562_029015 [Oryza meyeriana var. granulata]
MVLCSTRERDRRDSAVAAWRLTLGIIHRCEGRNRARGKSPGAQARGLLHLQRRQRERLSRSFRIMPAGVVGRGVCVATSSRLVGDGVVSSP